MANKGGLSWKAIKYARTAPLQFLGTRQTEQGFHGVNFYALSILTKRQTRSFAGFHTNTNMIPVKTFCWLISRWMYEGQDKLSVHAA